MQRLFERYGRVGTAPGSLDVSTSEGTGPVRLTVIRYGPDEFEEVEVDSAAACRERARAGGVTWINVEGVHRADIVEALGADFGLHPLMLEDVLHTSQRPKVDEFEDHLYVVLHMLMVAEDAEDGYAVDSEQVSLILTANVVLTFQERRGDVFDPIRDRIKHARGRVRKAGADYLLYALLDVIVDNYFVALERIGDRVEELDELVDDDSVSEPLRDIHAVRRALLQVRRTVFPVRDLIHTLLRGDSPLIKKTTLPFLRDVADHAVRVAESTETLRELTLSLADLHMSRMSHHMNQVMKVLTIIATIFIPMTFVAGVYGMNFTNMPELHWRYGYWAVWGVMVAMGGTLMWFFKRRDWL